MAAEGIVITDDQIIRFEVVYNDRNSGSIAANQFVRDGKFVHFWLIDNERMKQTYVITVRAKVITSIRPVYPSDARAGG